MSNSVNLSLDVTKTGIQNPLIKVRQGDGGFETLHTTVTSNGEPMDLQGWTITFMGTTAGNHKIVDGNVKLVEAPNGIFDYTPSKAWGMDIGEFKIAYFKFVKGDGSASSANFRVNVIEAVDLTQEEAQNYISVVDTTIAEINQHLTDSLASVTQSIADANTNANTVSSNVTALGSRVDDYNNKLAAIQVGGRNYILNSSGINSSPSNIPILSGGTGDSAALVSLQADRIVITNNQGNREFFYGLTKAYTDITKTPLIAGNTYTLSVKARGTSPQIAIRIGFQYMNPVALTGYTKLDSTKWTNATFTFTIPVGTPAIYMRLNGGINNQLSGFTGKEAIEFKEVMLEQSNVASDWTPAPEDAPSNDAQLVHKTGTETIAGDKTFTSTINGNAATATKWQTARTLALTGDVTGSVTMDGSGNVSIATTGANLVHKSGNESIGDDKTFTGTLITNGLKVSGDDYKNLVSGSANYFGATISFVRIGRQVTFTSSANAFNTSVSVGLTNNVLPNGFKPALQQNVYANNQDGANKFFSFDTSGSVYSYSAYTSGTQPRISGTYITTDAWPV